MTSFSIHRASFRPVLPSEADDIRQAFDGGETMTSIAARLRRSIGTVSKIVSGKRYRRNAPRREAQRASTPTAGKLAHITAEPWSPNWYEQQNEAFALAWREAFGEAVSFPHYAETASEHTLVK